MRVSVVDKIKQQRLIEVCKQRKTVRLIKAAEPFIIAKNIFFLLT